MLLNWIIRVCWGWLKKADVTACPLLVGAFQFSLHHHPHPPQFFTVRASSKIINSCSCPSLFSMDSRSSLFFQMPTQSQRWLILGLGMRLTLWWWKERAPVWTSTTCWDRRSDKKPSNRAQVSCRGGRRRSPHIVIFHTLKGRSYQFHFLERLYLGFSAYKMANTYSMFLFHPSNTRSFLLSQ